MINSVISSVLSILLTGGLVFVNLADEANATGRLKQEAIVASDTLKLGDLVEGLTQGSETPLFKAPAPGARGIIRAERILEAARELGIEGIDVHNVKIVTIIRPGRTISRQDIEDVLSRSAIKQGAKGDVTIKLDDNFSPRIIDAAKIEDMKITHFTRDKGFGRFEARLEVPNTNENWLVTGSIAELREVAVPTVDIERGEPLQAKDFILIKRPVAQVNGDVMSSLADLVGMLPRRSLRAGEPIRSADIAKPILVEKDQLVMVVYQSKGFSLTMRGRASAKGTMGETIKVMNPQSKRLVDAVVTGYGQVSVSPPQIAEVTHTQAQTPTTAQR